MFRLLLGRIGFYRHFVPRATYRRKLRAFRRHVRATVTHAANGKIAELARKHAHELEIIRGRHCEEMEETKRSVIRIVEANSAIRWRRNWHDREVYEVTISLRADLFGCLPHRGDIQMLAQHIGRQVEADIATSRFVRKAHEADTGRLGFMDTQRFADREGPESECAIRHK